MDFFHLRYGFFKKSLKDPNTAKLYKKILNRDLSIPKFVSDDAKDLINKILVIDPDQRVSCEGIKNHDWFSLHSPKCNNEGIRIGYNIIPVSSQGSNSSRLRVIY